MKTLKSKILLAALATTLGSGIAFSAPTGNEKKVVSKTSYQKDKANIREANADIRYHEANIERLEAKLKADKKADNDEAVILDRQNLRKAEADLKREKAYRKADEKALKSKHCLAIKSHKAELKEDRAELRKTKRQLKRDIRQENTAAVMTGAAAFAKKQREVDNGELALENQREQMASDLALVDEDRNVSKTSAEEQQTAMAYEGSRTFITPDYK